MRGDATELHVRRNLQRALAIIGVINSRDIRNDDRPPRRAGFGESQAVNGDVGGVRSNESRQ
jgi:hypothetical protein